MAPGGARPGYRGGAQGVHRVVEVGGSGTLRQSLKAVGPEGEVALIGFLASSDPAINYFEIFASGATLRVLAVGDRSGLADMLAAIGQAKLKPVVDSVHAFADAAGAYRRLASGEALGKVVVSI